MRLGHVPHDRQPQPKTTVRPTSALVQSGETIEDPLQRVRGQAGSIVFHGQARTRPVTLQDHAYRSGRIGRIAQGILQQVADDLTQTLFITRDHDRFVVHLDAGDLGS
jgi:hypothetical protein